MRQELKLKLLPNNQVSLFTQWVNRKGEERFLPCPDYSKEPDYVKEYHRNGQAAFDRDKAKNYTTERVAYYKADGAVKYRLLRVALPEPRPPIDADIMDVLLCTLDVTKKSQRSSRHTTGWGSRPSPRKFSSTAGQRIRECGAMMDKASGYNPSLCRVVTLTLPGDTHQAFRQISNYSGYIINRIFQPIRALGEADTKWFFVWEHQKRGALHLHIALYHPDKEISKDCGNRIIDKWMEALESVQER